MCVVTEILFNLLFGAVNVLLSFLPVIVLPTEIVGGLAGLVELFVVASYFVPINTVVFAIGVWFTLMTGKGLVVLANWLIRKIPGVA